MGRAQNAQGTWRKMLRAADAGTPGEGGVLVILPSGAGAAAGSTGDGDGGGAPD